MSQDFKSKIHATHSNERGHNNELTREQKVPPLPSRAQQTMLPLVDTQDQPWQAPRGKCCVIGNGHRELRLCTDAGRWDSVLSPCVPRPMGTESHCPLNCREYLIHLFGKHPNTCDLSTPRFAISQVHIIANVSGLARGWKRCGKTPAQPHNLQPRS